MNYATTATALRTTLTERGIKQPLWSGFQTTTKNGYTHIATANLGSTTFELRIKAQGRGYGWSFQRV